MFGVAILEITPRKMAVQTWVTYGLGHGSSLLPMDNPRQYLAREAFVENFQEDLEKNYEKIDGPCLYLCDWIGNNL
jgi:hypothetical protein